MENQNMRNDPLISVIMPVRNNERYFPVAVKSVLAQSYSNWELIIVEGLSTDNTSKIADEYANSYDNIKVYHEDEWIYESINLGIRYCTGDYVTVLNSDDFLEPDALEIAAKYIQKYMIDVFLFAVKEVAINSDGEIYDENGEAVLKRMSREFVIKGKDKVRNNWTNLLYSVLLNNQLNVYRKDMIKDIRFRNDVYGADYLFNLDVLPLIESIAYYPKCLYQFRSYQEEGMNASVGKFYDYAHKMFNEFFFKSVQVFETAGCISDMAMKVLRRKRMDEFAYQMDCYLYKSCPLTPENKLREMFLYANDVKPLYAADGFVYAMEDAVLTSAKSVLDLSDTEHYGRMQTVAEGIKEIYQIKEYNLESVDIGKIEAMVKDYYNPAHVGADALSKLTKAQSKK
ncbi:glycosyltransferase family 2 protein [Butyrivibrio proteoclasticus]|uniref:glycosyltransferase family 2 protein n=1 Tax=Butyrivibrio proteoclasticus TaxID=43305 RepID=UPI000478D460|nr:glycosyltransferase [Butyrivibrio proteoclasticus]